MIIDGRAALNRTVTVPADGSLDVTFDRSFPATGTYELGARLRPGDGSNATGATAGTVTVRAATAGHGDCSLLGYDFGGFVLCWYWWVLIDGLGAVALGYLVQTRREGVPGLTEDAPGAASRGRARAVARLAALGLGVALVALMGIVLLGLAGVPAPVEFLLTLAASLAIGAGLATRHIPDIGPVSGQTPPADD